MRSRFFALLCAALLLLTGCAPERMDDFDDRELVAPLPVEGLTAQTEFSEYDGKVEKIYVIVNNDRDDMFCYGEYFRLQKNVDGEWRDIKIDGYFNALALIVQPRSESSVPVFLKKHVKLPLLPGHYRIWIEQVSAEFDVK